MLERRGFIGIWGIIMIRGWMSKASAAMLLTASAFALNTAAAKAADFGGDCCADLEERIAELEATTARKGNRKVSLEVSGHVNEGIMVWDDGYESNAYVVTNDAGRTRFRFRGDAKISSDLSAGYLLEFGVRAARSDRVDQNSDDPGATIDIRHSNWYLKSKSLGKIQVGQGSGATESITEANITQTKDIAKNSDPEDHAAGFQLRDTGGNLGRLEWRDLVKLDFIQPGEGSRGNYVAYSSPKFGGFTFHASWGEDDFWDVSVKYKGEHHGIKIAAGIGYGQNTDEDSPTSPSCVASDASGFADCHQWGGSFSALHKSSGLFLTFGAGQFIDENAEASGLAFTGGDTAGDDEHTFYSFQAGIEKKFIPLGKTTVYGEYFNHDGGYAEVDASGGNTDAALLGAGIYRLADSEVEVYGGGIIQGIDAAAMRLYAFWRHYEAEATFIDNTGAATALDLEDLDVFMAGALIKF